MENAECDAAVQLICIIETNRLTNGDLNFYFQVYLQCALSAINN